MNSANYVFIAIFSLFLLSSKTRASASVLLFAYVPYYFCAMNIDGLGRYMAIGTIEVLAGCYLIYGSHLSRRVMMLGHHIDNSIAETYFISVIVNVLGGVFYWFYLPKEYYGNMCLTIMIIQMTILTWRITNNGSFIRRCSSIYPIFGAIVGSIHKRYSFLQSGKVTSQEVAKAK